LSSGIGKETIRPVDQEFVCKPMKPIANRTLQDYIEVPTNEFAYTPSDKIE
jgi:hypothetical protein